MKRANVQSDADGRATLSFTVRDRHAALSLTVSSLEALLSVEAVTDPSGTIVLDGAAWAASDQNLTLAVEPWYVDAVVNWPVRKVDPGLSAGTWTFDVLTTWTDGSAVPSADVAGSLALKEDDDLSTGALDVVVRYAADLEDDTALTTAVEQAVTEWQAIWAPAGVSVNVRYERADDLPATLPYPGFSEGLYDLQSSYADRGELTFIVGETIENELLYLGVAGNIPGSLFWTDRSVVTLAWLAHAGGDAVLDAGEIAVMGQTMAHEAGHYLGLFHPVEDGFAAWDALDDTPECSGSRNCQNNLGDNVMYYAAICSLSECETQTELTGDQAGVLQRFVGVL